MKYKNSQTNMISLQTQENGNSHTVHKNFSTKDESLQIFPSICPSSHPQDAKQSHICCLLKWIHDACRCHPGSLMDLIVAQIVSKLLRWWEEDIKQGRTTVGWKSEPTPLSLKKTTSLHCKKEKKNVITNLQLYIERHQKLVKSWQWIFKNWKVLWTVETFAGAGYVPLGWHWLETWVSTQNLKKGGTFRVIVTEDHHNRETPITKHHYTQLYCLTTLEYWNNNPSI